MNSQENFHNFCPSVCSYQEGTDSEAHREISTLWPEGMKKPASTETDRSEAGFIVARTSSHRVRLAAFPVEGEACCCFWPRAGGL